MSDPLIHMASGSLRRVDVGAGPQRGTLRETQRLPLANDGKEAFGLSMTP